MRIDVITCTYGMQCVCVSRKTLHEVMHMKCTCPIHIRLSYNITPHDRMTPSSIDVTRARLELVEWMRLQPFIQLLRAPETLKRELHHFLFHIVISTMQTCYRIMWRNNWTSTNLFHLSTSKPAKNQCLQLKYCGMGWPRTEKCCDISREFL